MPKNTNNSQSPQTQYQSMLEISETHFRRIIENNADSIIIVDQEGVIQFINPAGEALLGRKAAEVVGQTFGFPMIAGETTELDIIRQRGEEIVTAEMRVVETEWTGKTAYLASLRDITARKQAEEKIRFQAQLLNAVEQAIITTDLNGVITYWNRFAETLYGWSASEVIGRNIIESIAAPGTESQAAGIITALNQGQSWSGEFLVKHRDETIFPAMVTASPIYDSEGRLVGIVGVSLDISERKQVEEALKQYNRDLMQLTQAGQALNVTLDPDEVLATILTEAHRLLKVTACSIWLIDQNSGELVCRQATGSKKEIVQGWRLGPGQGLVGWVRDSGRNLIVPDVKSNPHHFKEIDQQTGLALRSILTVPLQIKETIIGVLQLVDTRVNRFSLTDSILMELLATTASIAIENARLYEQARQDAETKAMLLHEVNHRVKNNLTAIIGLLYAERHRVDVKNQPTYRTILQDVINRIQGLATVHNLLSASEWSPISLNELIEQVIDAALQMLPLHQQISVQIHPSSIQIMPQQANSLALVINELTTNTAKYALTERNSGQIIVRIRLEDETVVFEFRDDGPGYPPEVLKMEHHNVGLYLIREIVQNDLHGEIFLHNDQGAVTTIRYPRYRRARIRSIEH